MAPLFLLPETVVRANGASAASEIESGWRSAQLTLGITEIVEQESLDLVLEGSTDGTTWLQPPLAAFPQKFYAGTTALLFELPADPPVRFLRVRWTVNRWGRGSLEPRFGIYVVLEPVA
jgi:hypothetical protein